MNIPNADIQGSVSRDSVCSVSKLLLVAAWLMFVVYLFTILPGVDRVIPRTRITLAALVGAAVTFALVGLLLYSAPKLATLVRVGVDAPREIVENVSSVVYWSMVLAAVLVAHRGFIGIARPFVDGSMWIYDIVFLLSALPVVTFIAARLYASLDPSSELVADKITGSETDANDENPDERT